MQISPVDFRIYFFIDWKQCLNSTANSCQGRHALQDPVSPGLRSCCLVYSQISRAPLTWTLRERMIPCWGISTHTSSCWIRFAGIPSRSLLMKRNRRREVSFLVIINFLLRYSRCYWKRELNQMKHVYGTRKTKSVAKTFMGQFCVRPTISNGRNKTKTRGGVP